MALSIKSERADQLARELAELTGKSITEAVAASLEYQLELERRKRHRQVLRDIVERFRALPVLDGRPSEEVIGYNEHGLPV